MANLTDGQVVQLADGIVEVRHLRRGCLVFIGPVYQRSVDSTYWFLDQSAERRLEITRLGIVFGIVSQVPDTFSEDFRWRLADAAGMDGETIVFTALSQGPPEGFLVDQPPGSVQTGRFVQLPQDTPALLDMTKPMISREYADAWGLAAQSVKAGDIHNIHTDTGVHHVQDRLRFGAHGAVIVGYTSQKGGDDHEVY